MTTFAVVVVERELPHMATPETKVGIPLEQIQQLPKCSSDPEGQIYSESAADLYTLVLSLLRLFGEVRLAK